MTESNGTVGRLAPRRWEKLGLARHIRQELELNGDHLSASIADVLDHHPKTPAVSLDTHLAQLIQDIEPGDVRFDLGYVQGFLAAFRLRAEWVFEECRCAEGGEKEQGA